MIQPYSWALYRPPDELNYSLVWTSIGKEDAWDEKACDDCMHELLNKTRSDGRCNLSEDCWRKVISDEQSGYSLAHQVIYILLGINICSIVYGASIPCLLHVPITDDSYPQSGCLEDLERMTRETTTERSLDKLLQTLCTRIFIEANSLAAADFPLEYRDLFMEQIGICGDAGFVDQTELSWLEHILSWQAPIGCYYQFDHEYIDPINFDPNGYGTYRRKKRAEKAMGITGTTGATTTRTITSRKSARRTSVSPSSSRPQTAAAAAATATATAAATAKPHKCLAHRTNVALLAMRSFLVRFVETLYGVGAH
ncbi:unnamed protein product [Echinostoma caproni]|uniref:Expressed conserved protein n=1 Tax=Echinostoma caproni TaxID=27848 RepID=A0A183AT42_9TREM|nr:unnamed protein product [Echinostoma caproni]